MNEIERAIEYFSGYGSPHDKLIVQALKEKAERDKMLCCNCKHEPKNPTSEILPCFMCSIGYASYFEVKENENNG